MAEYNIEDRAQPFTPVWPCITIKDHKDNYLNNTQIRLICPDECDLGKLSKEILDKYIPSFRNKIKLEVWTNTQNAIAWFTNIKYKDKYKLLQTYIKNYSSINPTILNSALIFSKNHTKYKRYKCNPHGLQISYWIR